MSKVITNYCLLLFCLGSCLFVPRLAAQAVGIYVEDVQAELGGTASVNIRVTNFSDIAGVQFSLHWDPTQLSFTGLENLALGANESGSFNRETTAAGMLGYLHADMSLEGYDLSDGGILFTANFNVLLPNDASADVTFTSDPIEMVLANSTGAAIPSEFTDGAVTVGMPPNAVREIRVNDSRFTASPNPFETTTVLTFIAERAGMTDLSVYDVAGKQVFQNNITLITGKNNLSLTAKQFPEAGIYLLKMTTEYGTFSRKLVFSGCR